MHWSGAEEQGPLLGPERVGQCASGAQTIRNREKTRRGRELEERREAIKRKKGGESEEIERTSVIICNSLCALLRHFIQHLVKRDLFCFSFVVRRSQFVGSFVKRWTASVASRRCHGAEKTSLTQLECRWESGLWRLPVYAFKHRVENNEN